MLYKFALRFDHALMNYVATFYQHSGEQLGVALLMHGTEDESVHYFDVGFDASAPYVIVSVNSPRPIQAVSTSILDAITAAIDSLDYKGEVSPSVVAQEIRKQCTAVNALI